MGRGKTKIHGVKHGHKLGSYRQADERGRKATGAKLFHTKQGRKHSKRRPGKTQKARAPPARKRSPPPEKPRGRIPGHEMEVTVTAEEAARLRERDAREGAALRARYATRSPEERKESAEEERQRRERYSFKTPEAVVAAADRAEYDRRLNEHTRNERNKTHDQRIFERHGTRFDPMTEFKVQDQPRAKPEPKPKGLGQRVRPPRKKLVFSRSRSPLQRERSPPRRSLSRSRERERERTRSPTPLPPRVPTPEPRDPTPPPAAPRPTGPIKSFEEYMEQEYVPLAERRARPPQGNTATKRRATGATRPRAPGDAHTARQITGR